MEETLSITKANALEAHKTADAGGKALLEKLLGKKHFCTDMRDIIDSFEAACDYNNTNPQDPRFTQGTEQGIATEMIAEIAKALNGGRVMTGTERRFYPWFEYTTSGFRFFAARCTDSLAGSGPRLCVLSSDLATYIGTKFISLYQKMLS